jgi:hypothetical protein
MSAEMKMINTNFDSSFPSPLNVLVKTINACCQLQQKQTLNDDVMPLVRRPMYMITMHAPRLHPVWYSLQ